MTGFSLRLLEKKVRQIRLRVLAEVYRTGKGHIGSTFSCVDILAVLYYDGFIKLNKKNSQGEARDKFILSKGHACLALYCILSDLGIIPDRKLSTYGLDGGLGGQLDIKLPGVDFNTGSLGHSVGVAAGMALANKLDNKKQGVYTLIGDSELFEGSVWEAIIFAGDNNIGNLTCIIDRNKFTVCEKLLDNSIYKNLGQKIKMMGWNFIEIDGHDFKQLITAFKKTTQSTKPTMILANTIKGKGVSFMENGLGWYTQSPTTQEYSAARKELSEIK